MRIALTPLIAALVLLGTCGSAAAKTTSVSAGGVTATLTYRTQHGFQYAERLQIRRGPRVLYDARAHARGCGSLPCGVYIASHVSPLTVTRLAGAGVDVVLALNTLGAHCCQIDQVFTLNPAGTAYRKAAERNFGDYGAVIERPAPARVPVFRSGDWRFDYAFGSFASTGQPVQIFRFTGARFVDVTRSYPKLVARDAALWWRAFTHHLRDGEGVLAAWAADEYLLGHRTQVARTLRRELRSGHLRSASPGVPTGARYITALERFLTKLGYAR